MTPSKFGIIGALWFLTLVNYFDRVAMSFAGPSIMKSLHMSPAAFGIVLSSFSIGYLLAQVPGGLLSDRFGARVVMVIGPLLWAAFTGATGLVATLAGFVVVRVLFGLSEGLSNASIYKIVGENFGVKERSRIVATISSPVTLAPAFAGVLIGKLIISFGWNAMFVILAGPAIVAAVVCFALLPKAPKREPVAHATPGALSFQAVLGRRSLWLIAVASLCWNVTYWGFLGWMPSYLALARHIDLKSVGPLGSVIFIFAFFGMVSIGWLASGPLHRFCASLVTVCFLGGSFFLYLAYQASSVQMSLVGLSGAAFFLFGASGPVGKILLDLAPASHRAAYVGVYSMVGQLGGVFAPVAIGFLVTTTGSFSSGFSMMVAALLVAAVLVIGATMTAQRELVRDALPPEPAS